MTDIKTQLDKLALSIVQSALNPVEGQQPLLFPDKLDAFKALTTYHLGTLKAKKKSGEDDNPEKGETFDDFRNSVETGGAGS